MHQSQSLKRIAQTSLEANIVDTTCGRFLAAGSNQFKTLWVRDFCFSLPGLMLLGHRELVKNQLSLFLSYVDSRGLAPRGVDVVPPQRRVVMNTAFRFLPRLWRSFNYAHKDLKPEYLGEHKTIAFDSNILLIEACLKYFSFTKDIESFNLWRPKLKALFKFYESFCDGRSFFSQPPFSDWQDSTSRQGQGLYFHVLYLKSLKLLEELNQQDVSTVIRENIEDRIGQYFFDQEQGLFVQDPNLKQVPLEANLWILQHQFFSSLISRETLRKNLFQHPIWHSLGLPVWPQSPKTHVSWTTKAVGLRHYHDNLRWSWLMAEAAKTAIILGDMAVAQKILQDIEELALGSNALVSEVYYKDSSHQFSSLLYTSETPFSWGAAKIVEALSYLVQD